MFRSLLVANRGEIACRILRTARGMGLRTIAVFSEADRGGLHTRLADTAVFLGPSPARESYLRADRIIAAAVEANAEAIHPGYGFLSERPDLPRACAQSGLTWVGPHVGAIEAMGSKIEAKRRALAQGVPVIPGYHGEDQSNAALSGAALSLGLPVMIKASGGGGGRGMRAVHAAGDLSAAIDSARREAEAAFGDGRLLIEKLITHSRHVEVQVLGDKHGHLLHLFERDCSIQRKNQKLIEEAPAPHLSDDTRASLYEHSLRLAKSIDYDSLGTIEYVLDSLTGKFHFLEMNTRLQVEHTVTEAITGLDLVELQLQVAAGRELPLRQEDVVRRGHAVQARLTAERADEDFRPDSGCIFLWSSPSGVRVDTGVETGTEIGLHYDSLLAKIVSHRDDRLEAVDRLTGALDRLTLVGVATNRVFLRDALRAPVFVAGRATTRFIAEQFPSGWSRPLAALPEARRIAAVACALYHQHVVSRSNPSPWSRLGGFRLMSMSGQPAHAELHVACEQKRWPIRLSLDGQRWVAADDDGSSSMTALLENGRLVVELNGLSLEVPVAFEPHSNTVRVALRVDDLEAVFEVRQAVDAALEAGSAPARLEGEDAIVAPMPGVLVELCVAVGDQVAPGYRIAVLESMKLFHDLKSAVSGRVAAIPRQRGATVAVGETLVRIETSPVIS
jgi:3-methylcrotonyl-CoA carboxylase alpha subunit